MHAGQWNERMISISCAIWMVLVARRDDATSVGETVMFSAKFSNSNRFASEIACECNFDGTPQAKCSVLFTLQAICRRHRRTQSTIRRLPFGTSSWLRRRWLSATVSQSVIENMWNMNIYNDLWLAIYFRSNLIFGAEKFYFYATITMALIQRIDELLMNETKKNRKFKKNEMNWMCSFFIFHILNFVDVRRSLSLSFFFVLILCANCESYNYVLYTHSAPTSTHCRVAHHHYITPTNPTSHIAVEKMIMMCSRMKIVVRCTTIRYRL